MALPFPFIFLAVISIFRTQQGASSSRWSQGPAHFIFSNITPPHYGYKGAKKKASTSLADYNKQSLNRSILDILNPIPYKEATIRPLRGANEKASGIYHRYFQPHSLPRPAPIPCPSQRYERYTADTHSCNMPAWATLLMRRGHYEEDEIDPGVG